MPFHADSFRPMVWRVALLAVGGVVVASCVSSGEVGSDAAELADVEGNYNITLRYGSNGCLLESWTEGAELGGVVLEMRQDGSSVTGTVPGVTGGVLSLIHGSNVYTGTLDGGHASMVIYGTTPGVEGNCTYSLNNRVEADFEGDFVSGSLAFVKEGNDNPDCGAVECASEIAFTGSRPPRAN